MDILASDGDDYEMFASGRCSYHGQRVVEGQRLMQAASDIFLGWQRISAPDGATRDFYVRPLCDWKATAAVDTMDPELLAIYAGMCAWTLARGARPLRRNRRFRGLSRHHPDLRHGHR